MKYVIYGIIDPGSDEFFYVGHSDDFGYRKAQHLKGSDQISGLYIQILKEQGLEPHFCILERCPSREDAMAAEVSWIRKIIGLGFKLKNSQAFNGYTDRQKERRRLTAALERLRKAKYQGDHLVHIANGRDYNRDDGLSRDALRDKKKSRSRGKKSALTQHEKRRFDGMRRAGLPANIIAINLGRSVDVIEAEIMKF